jgi:hypothetical protein
MNAVQILTSAARELASYIDKENERLKNNISCDDLDPPDYHDHQTCQELIQLAIQINKGKL